MLVHAASRCLVQHGWAHRRSRWRVWGALRDGRRPTGEPSAAGHDARGGRRTSWDLPRTPVWVHARLLDRLRLGHHRVRRRRAARRGLPVSGLTASRHERARAPQGMVSRMSQTPAKPFLPPRWFIRARLGRPPSDLSGHRRPARPRAADGDVVRNDAPPHDRPTEWADPHGDARLLRGRPEPLHARDERVGRAGTGMVAQPPGDSRRDDRPARRSAPIPCDERRRATSAPACGPPWRRSTRTSMRTPRVDRGVRPWSSSSPGRTEHRPRRTTLVRASAGCGQTPSTTAWGASRSASRANFSSSPRKLPS